MALFSERMQCARKVLDTADIVREARLHQLRVHELPVADNRFRASDSSMLTQHAPDEQVRFPARVFAES